jgi:iron complex outermembrane receptor protein
MFLPEMRALWRANPRYAAAIASGRMPSGGSAADNALAADAIRAIRALGPRAIAPTCVEANQDFVEGRYTLEAQDTWVVSERLRMVNGLGISHEYGESDTYLGGRDHNNNVHLFSNVEYKALPWLSVHAGGFWEHETLNGSAFSPRVGLNIRPSQKHAFRFSVSKGTRLPDIQEQRAQWSYLATNARPALNGQTDLVFFQTAQARGNLHGENNIETELGYFGNLPEYGLMVDAKLFTTKLYRLISEKQHLADFNPTNGNSVRLQGAEFQVTYQPSDRWNLHATYAYLRNHDATSALEQTQLSHHSGTLGVTRNFDHGWRAGLMLYAADAEGHGQSSYGRQDLLISKQFRLGTSHARASFTARHLDTAQHTYFVDFNNTVANRYNREMQYFVTLQLAY